MSSRPGCCGITASKIGRRHWTQSNPAARLLKGSASARSIKCTPNASRPSAIIRPPRIGTASTRRRANSLLRPVAPQLPSTGSLHTRSRPLPTRTSRPPPLSSMESTPAVRRDTRAGHYELGLQTKAGEVQLRVPKLRQQTFETAIIERYRRRESSVEEALIEMYLAGVSVRRVEDITEALWGTRVSPSTVSDLNKKIYGTIEAWRNRPIEGEHPPQRARRPSE